MIGVVTRNQECMVILQFCEKGSLVGWFARAQAKGDWGPGDEAGPNLESESDLKPNQDMRK